MNIERLPSDQKLVLCRKYYMAGFALLPFMWTINFIWFFRDAFLAPSFSEQKRIRCYVIISGIGSLVWLVGLVTWIIVFQQHRSEWGATADYMSFMIPRGIP
ncbi:presenilin enhancer, gamma-secretase subunit [Oratosquilla oratoria]|uniref:presenilin enhancer, gamma-secretase subunit n=1 Tax=Oratosquilla oratoria TaxID=337810 RepID=UPI003F7718DB